MPLYLYKNTWEEAFLKRGIVSLQFPKIVDLVPLFIKNYKEDRSFVS